MNSNPIGILDSGIGGLSIFKEISSLLPFESIVYIGDQANVPYGSKSGDEVYDLAKKLVTFLKSKNVKLIVVACNVISVTSLNRLRDEFNDMHFVGTVPVIKTASEVTKNGRIGILSTITTSKSNYQRDLIDKFAKDKLIVNLGTDKLVPLIEEGTVNGIELESVLNLVLSPFISQKVDTLVLACTHFPFLKQAISRIMGEKVSLLDSSLAVARNTKSVLQKLSLVSDKSGSISFYTTGNSKKVSKIASNLLGKEVVFDPIVI